VQGQLGYSWDGPEGGLTASPIWSAEFDRTGRAWGFNYRLNGIGESFRALSGYVPRDNIVEGRAMNRLTFYGERGALLESFSTNFNISRIWRFSEFRHGDPMEGDESLNLQFQLRGGWNLTSRTTRDFVRFDPDLYTGYQINRPGDVIEAFSMPEMLEGAFGESLSLSTPTFRTFGGRVQVSHSESPIFPEAARGRETVLTLSANLRPAGTVRIETSGTLSHLARARDGSEFARTVIPRFKVEYQPRRSLFFRAIGEYRSQRRAALQDPYTGDPLVVDDELSTAQRFNGLRIDLLISFEPTPGTVAFFGYGSSMDTERTFGITDLQRSSDGLFLKLAYQFRH
jgi:hypothetical protein